MRGQRAGVSGGGRARRVYDERGQSLVIVLGLISVLFLMGSAMAAHVSVALRSTAAGDAQASEFHAADAGAELGIWWQRNGRAGNPPPMTVNGVTATTTISATGGGCPSSTPIRITGFEHGAVSTAGGGLFSTLRGTGATADPAVARSGGWSLRVVGSSARDFATLATPGGVVAARVYVRLATLPVANVTELLTVDLAAGSDLRLGYQASTQRLTLRFGSGALTQATTAIAAGTWVRLDARVTANTNPRRAEWQLDGLGQPAISASAAPSTVRTLRLGSNVGADRYTINFDDIVVSATSGDYPIGDGRVLPLRPDGAGSHATPGSFRNDDSTPIDTTTPARLDDDPLTSTADYVLQQAAGAASYVETTLEDLTAPCVAGVSGIVAYRSASSPANNGRTSVIDGAREMIVFQGDMSVTALTYRSAILTRPGGWVPAAVDGLVARIGRSTDVNPNPYWDAVLLEVATSDLGTPATVTVTSTAGASTVVTTYVDAGAGAPSLLTWVADR